MSLISDALIVNKNGKAGVPCTTVLEQVYRDTLPNADETFTNIITRLQQETINAFHEHGNVILPTSNSFNNCNGRWAEYLYTVAAWNTLAQKNKETATLATINPNANDNYYIYVRFPNNTTHENDWISLLVDECKNSISNYQNRMLRFPEVQAVINAIPPVHKGLVLTASNPDSAIFQFPKSELDSFDLGIDYCKEITNFGSHIAEKLDAIFSKLKGKVLPSKNLGCFLSVKKSVRPDRRFQFIQEGNYIKLNLRLLKREGADVAFPDNKITSVYYATSLDKVSDNDRIAMDSAFAGCFENLTNVGPIWAVDRFFECLHFGDVKEQILYMIET